MDETTGVEGPVQPGGKDVNVHGEGHYEILILSIKVNNWATTMLLAEKIHSCSPES